MADDNCLTPDDDDKKWTSTLIPTGSGEEPDGKISITKESNKLKGKHKKDGKEIDLENLMCDGTNISFDRVGTKNGKTIRIFYKNGVISEPSSGKYKIKGKYEEVVIKDNADFTAKSAYDKSKTKAEAEPPDPPDGDTGDWKAERPTA